MSNQPSRWPNIASTVTAIVERQRPPEAAPEVDQLRVLAFLEARHLRLERHAALRAGARMVLAHLRMHRAGVDRARPAPARRRPPAGATGAWAQVPGRIGARTSPAPGAAEVVRAGLRAQARCGDCGRHRHAADRILRGSSRMHSVVLHGVFDSISWNAVMVRAGPAGTPCRNAGCCHSRDRAAEARRRSPTRPPMPQLTGPVLAKS